MNLLTQYLNLAIRRLETSIRIWSYLLNSKNKKESIGFNKWFFFNLSLPWQMMNFYYWDDHGQPWGKSLFTEKVIKFLKEQSTNA